MSHNELVNKASCWLVSMIIDSKKEHLLTFNAPDSKSPGHSAIKDCKGKLPFGQCVSFSFRCLKSQLKIYKQLFLSFKDVCRRHVESLCGCGDCHLCDSWHTLHIWYNRHQECKVQSVYMYNNLTLLWLVITSWLLDFRPYYSTGGSGKLNLET